MKNQRIDIASIRRAEIVEAAVAVIAEKGLQNLSLSQIEKKAGMSRGQLTYYFPTKEDILLAVFDRFLFLMYQRMASAADHPCETSKWWDWVLHLFSTLLQEPPPSPEFNGLQYTFLAQSSHREDFRQRLAKLYEEWRGHMTQGLTVELTQECPVRDVPPRAMATVVQALLHGLTMQLAADPKAFDREETVKLCLDML